MVVTGSARTSDSTIQQIPDAVTRLIQSRVEQMGRYPVEASDARLHRQILVLVVGQERTEHDAVQSDHQVFLHVIHQSIHSVAGQTCNSHGTSQL